MKASELRIGNFINSPNGQIIVSGIETDFDDLTGGENSVNDFPLSKLQPIPITEEWLEKLGFKQYGMNEFEHIDNGLYIECSYDLRYVHQLQNIFFALTNTELIIR